MRLTKNLFYYPEAGMMGCNTYVIRGDITVIIDVGMEQNLLPLIQGLVKDGIETKKIDIITSTHLHIDHASATQTFKEISGAKIALHPKHKEYFDLNLKKMPKLFEGFGFGFKIKEFKEDSLLEDELDIGDMKFKLLHTPGHSPDSICFYCEEEKVLICGDLVFEQSTGRVDFPGGSAVEIKRSIERVALLDIEYLLPGHMGIIKGKEAVKRNFDFVREFIFPWL